MSRKVSAGAFRLHRRQWLREAALLAAGGLLAACAAPTPPPTGAPAAKPTEPPKPAGSSPTPATATSPSPAASPAAAGPAVKPAAGGPLTKVTILNGGEIVTWAPSYVAIDRGFFRDEGLDVEYTLASQGATTAVAAVVSGNAFMAFTGTPVVVNAVRRGSPIRILLVASAEYGTQMTASNKFLEARGVSPQSPVEQKALALKGAKIGIDSPGDSNDQFARFVLRKYSINADTEVELVSLQNISNKMAALQRGSIDVMIASPPSGQQIETQGYGKVYISPAEFPEIKGYPYLVGSANLKDIQERPQLVKSVVKAMARAEYLLRTDPEGTKPSVRRFFQNFEQAAFDFAYQFAISALPATPVLTRESFAALENFAKLQGQPLNLTYEQLVEAKLAEEAVQEVKV